MSASPMARQVTESRTIPTKKIFINDPSELPSEYSSTPGGTLYSTTPGGTKLVYEKAFLMNLRNSPISKTPPNFSSNIPDSILRNSTGTSPVKSINSNRTPRRAIAQPIIPKRSDDEEQFQFEI